MNANSSTRVVVTREDAHDAARQVYTIARLLIHHGKRVSISVCEEVTPISVHQRKFLHGPVMVQISEQVRVLGERFIPAIWKRYYKNLILEREPKFELIKIPGDKEALPVRVYRSTEDLSVKQYSEFIDEVIAHATTEFNVNFRFNAEERDAVRYVRPKRNVDATTGEILEAA
jgi:hypothetical protein